MARKITNIEKKAADVIAHLYSKTWDRLEDVRPAELIEVIFNEVFALSDAGLLREEKP